MGNDIRKVNRTLLALSLGVSILVFISSGCEELKRSFKETFESEKRIADQKSNSSSIEIEKKPLPIVKSLFADRQKLMTIQQELINLPEFKDKEVILFKNIVFYDFQGGHINLKIKDPVKPKNFDEYNYRSPSGWSKGKPVKISSHHVVDIATMPLNKLDFGVVYQIQQTVAEKSMEIEGAEPNTFIYFYNFGHSREKKWNAHIVGARKDYILEFNLAGDLLEMREH